MRRSGVGSIIGGALSLSIVLLIVISVLKWLDLMIGSPIDWVIGFTGFWWLLIVVTIPWNIYFKTKEILANANKLKDEKINERDTSYARKLGKYALSSALLLHVLSSGIFYLLAYYEITPIGYIASIIALLLTILRPLIRAYEYVNKQLLSIESSIKYPEDNVYKLIAKVDKQEHTIRELKEKLDLNNNSSWAFEIKNTLDVNQSKIDSLVVKLNESNENNMIEHNRISKESKDAMAQLTIDGEFLNHVREIIRFFKKA